MLQYIHQDNITEDICITAILQNCMALDYVKEQSEEICKVSVQLDGNALSFLKIEQTEELCKLCITICKESN